MMDRSKQEIEDEDEEDEFGALEGGRISQDKIAAIPHIITLFKCSFSILRKSHSALHTIDSREVSSVDLLI